MQRSATFCDIHFFNMLSKVIHYDQANVDTCADSLTVPIESIDKGEKKGYLYVKSTILNVL